MIIKIDKTTVYDVIINQFKYYSLMGNCCCTDQPKILAQVVVKQEQIPSEVNRYTRQSKQNTELTVVEYEYV